MVMATADADANLLVSLGGAINGRIVSHANI